MNAAEDGQAGIQEMGGNATLLFYQSPEGNEVSTVHVAGVVPLQALMTVCVFMRSLPVPVQLQHVCFLPCSGA